MKFERSQQLFEYGARYLSGGVSSNFRYGGYGESPVPLYYTKGEGSRITDADGNVYIDYALGNGPIILGHAPKSVLDQVVSTLSMGQLFAGQTELEANLAKKICDLVPCAERIRFASSGTETIQAAVRLARAYTGRAKIMKFEGHYHGWTDNIFVSVNPPLDQVGEESNPISVSQTPGQSSRALEDVVTLPWNNLDLFAEVMRNRGHEIAAVVMEPINCNTGAMLPLPGYLEGVRQITSDCGTVLIFDEVITGFRVGLAGAQGLFGVTPDMAIFAKALAAGFPLAVLAGKKSIMDLLHTASVMHGGTYNANVVAVAAGLATIGELEANQGRAYQHMTSLGEHLMEGLRMIASDFRQTMTIQGLGTVFHPLFAATGTIRNYREFAGIDHARKNRFYARLQSAGTRVTARGTWFLSTAHSNDDVEQTLEHARHAMRIFSNE